ncbi:hypothetical protein BsWGS_23544 [Bradybaena similaris]
MAAPTHKMDEGWAWVVLACSWMSLFLVCFLSATAGIIQVEIVEDLGVGAGPVSFMTSCALGLASLLGLGFGIAYSPMVVITSFYFEKYRMLANGVILCASGVGMLSLPFFERYLIDSHGWRFAFALNGTIMLHILIFASVFFPTELEKKGMIKFDCFWKTKPGNEKSASENKRNNNNIDGSCDPEIVVINCHQITNGVQPKTLDLIRKSGLLVDSSSIKSKSQSLSISGNETNAYILVSASETTDGDKCVQPLLDDSHLTSVREAPLRNSLLPEDKEYGVFHSSPFRKRTFSEVSARSMGSTVTQISTHGLSQPKDSYKFGQLRKGSSTGRSYLGSSFGWASSDLGSSLMFPVKIEEVICGEAEEQSSLKEQIIRICRHKAVWILSINSLFFIGGYAIHGIHFPAYAESKGMTRAQVAHFYIVYGLVLMFGRLGGGWIFNKLKPPLCVLIFILQSLNGISMALAPFYATNPVGIYILQASFGLLYGQSYMVLPAVLAQILGVQDLPIAFGIIHLFMGVGYIVAPVIAGFIFDVTETYDIPYYVGGGLYLVGALSLLLMMFVKREADAGDVAQDLEEQKEQTQDGSEEQTKIPLVGSHNATSVAEVGSHCPLPAAQEEKLCM